MRKILAAVLLTGLAAAGHAAEWVLIDGAGDSLAFIDTQSIAPAGDTLLKAWVTFNYSEPQKLSTDPSQEYMSIATLYYLNCTERTSGILQEVLFSEPGRTGKTIQHISNDRRNLILKDVIPDSIGESILKHACAYRKPKSKR